jgi:predicted dehydrogenase
MYEELALDYPVGYVRWTEQRNMEEFVRLLALGQVDVSALITHRFPVEQAAEAYAVLSKPSGGALGVLLEYPSAAPRDAHLDPSVPASERIRVARPASTPVAQGKVGVGFLGAGNFATATLLPALSKDRRFAPRGVFTMSGLSARAAAKRHHFAYCAGSPEDILSDVHTTGVVIATRHGSHAELAEKALRAGKTVFVEKPLALSEEQLAAVVRVQRETGGRLTVGFNRRFSPLTRAVVGELERRSSPLSALIRVNAGALPPEHWIQRLEEGGGRVLGEACHFVDLAACLVGDQAASVYAVSADPAKPAALTDTLVITLSYPEGSVATIVYAATGDTAYPKERVEIFCEGTVLVIDDFKTLTTVAGGKTRVRRLSRTDKGHAAEMKAFLDLAQGSEAGILTFADCVSSTATTLKVIQSLTTGDPVEVPRVSFGY